MFHDSTQRSHWLFSTPLEIRTKREDINQRYYDKTKDTLHPSVEFLSVDEECKLVNEYVRRLLEFCSTFQPPVPLSTVTTAVHYLKRFYLLRSVMDYHPKDIYMCCVFLAFKVDEYNQDADQFTQGLPEEQRKRTGDLVLHLEPILMLELSFQLIIHSAFRSLDGLLFDLKTKYPKLSLSDQLKKVATGFLMHHFYSDICFLYPPSQVALASLMHSANHSKVDIASFFRELSMDKGSTNTDQPESFMKRLRDIEKMVVSAVGTGKEEVVRIEIKLKACCNAENSPEHPRFWKKKGKKEKEKDKDLLQEDSSTVSAKRRKIAGGEEEDGLEGEETIPF